MKLYHLEAMFRKKGPKELQLAKEDEVKRGITQALSQALKSVQKEHILVDTDDRVVYSTDTANSVCSCLEATFLHGLKASSAKKIASYMGLGQQRTSQVAVNFWAIASKFTHGEVISQLKHLGQITTEIGLCRAWVRVGLNDNLMESYVDALCSDKKTLEYFYHSTAYLRDREHPGILKSLLGGLMAFEFKLSYNASVLNEWAYLPLTLCGLVDPMDAPLPVIKPAATKRATTTKSPGTRRSQPDTLVEVRQIRSGSRGSSNDEKDKSNSHDSKNPMETPQIGKPGPTSYIVSASEFTSEDVTQFKNLAINSSPTSHSVGSTNSSHISCPDPPNLNLSPAEYVRKGKYSSPRVSSKLTLSNTSTDSGGIAKDLYTGKATEHTGVFGNLSDINNEQPKSAKLTGYIKRKIDVVLGTDSVKKDPKVTGNPEHIGESIHKNLMSSSPVGFTVNDSVEETYLETDGAYAETIEDKSKDGKATNELEESWNEFYEEPVARVINEEPRKRLESINQDMKLKSILDDFIDVDEPTGADSLQASTTTITNSESKLDCDVVGETNANIERDIGGEQINTVGDSIDAVIGTMVKVDSNQDDIARNVESELRKLNSERKKVLERFSGSAGSSPVSDKSSGFVPYALTHSNLELFNKEFDKGSGHIDEMIGVRSEESYDIDEVKHQKSKESSPKKKRGGKARGKKDRMKPELPRIEHLEPELSEAVAGTVDTVEQLRETLATKRMSLPVTKQEKSAFPSVISMPNMSEITEATLPNSASEGNFDEHLRQLYDGVPLDIEDSEMRASYVQDDRRQSLGNSLASGRGWSSSIGSEFDDTVEPMSPPREPKVTVAITTRPKAESFGSLLQNYTPASSLSAPSIDDVLHNLPRTSTILSSPKSPEQQEEFGDTMDGFEIVTESHMPDAVTLGKLTHLSEIANEKGLDAQNFQCSGCTRPLGLIFGKPRVCVYDGGYYCFECHENDEYYIPAVIVHNWDFRKQKVSKKNYEFLQEIEEQPLIELEVANPRLYDHVPEMAEIRQLRTQLIFLKTYLFTCKQSIVEDFQRLVWPRDYLYENIELYSLADLLQVPTGALASSLRKVIRYATKHVYGCRLCSQKGFICELCSNPKVIYPFEMDTTYRCPGCRSVFHRACKTDNRPCPKCHRRSLRGPFQGIEASISDYDVNIQSYM